MLKLSFKKFKIFYYILLCIFTISTTTMAQSQYNVIISAAPGGAVDSSFKQFASVMAESGIEFKPTYKVGAAGLIAMKEFVESSDAKQLIWVGSGLSIGNNVIKKSPEFTDKEYRTILMTESTPLLFIKSPRSNKIEKFSDLFQAGCNQHLIVAVGGLMHEVAGRILEKTSSCKVSVVLYQGDAAPIADVMNGSIDIAIIPFLTGSVVIEQGGKILATTANIDDKEWENYPLLSNQVPGANIYLLYGLLASNKINDAEYKKLLSLVRKNWDNISIRDKHLKIQKGFRVRAVYGKEYQDFLNNNISSLRKLAEELNFQK